jgi:ribosomal protein L17
LVRGRVDTQEFAPTLGSDKSEAEAALRRLLCELDDGTYIRSSEQKSRSLRRRNAPRHTVITLADEFLEHTSNKSGVDTCNTYRSRLAPVLTFAEQAHIKARWRSALDIDREFLDRLRQHLLSQHVTRNGRPGGKKH